MRTFRRFLILLLVVITFSTLACSSMPEDLKPRIVEYPITEKVASYEKIPLAKLHLKSSDDRISKSAYNKLDAGCDYDDCGDAGTVNWRGDLNSDNVLDYIVMTGSFGTAGAEFMVLASRVDGKHGKVLQEYGSFKVEDSRSKWKAIVLEEYRRNEEQKCPADSNGPKMILHSSSYEWDGTNYQRNRAWDVFPEPPCI